MHIMQIISERWDPQGVGRIAFLDTEVQLDKTEQLLS